MRCHEGCVTLANAINLHHNLRSRTSSAAFRGSASWSAASSPMYRFEHKMASMRFREVFVHSTCDWNGVSNFDVSSGNVYATHWPLSNTFTPPSPPTKYKTSFSSTRFRISWNVRSILAPTVILRTPLISLAVPVSNNLKLIVKSASCAMLSTKAAWSFSRGDWLAETRG